jgi:branched-chain amino acid transport system permease protein
MSVGLRVALAAVVLAAVVAAANRMGSYATLLAWTFCLQATLALSYDILGGYGAEMPLGHGLFFGLGAYVAAQGLLAGVPAWGAVLLAGAGGGLAAWGVRPLLVPLRAGAFALGSLALLLLAGVLARNLTALTGGVSGISPPRSGQMTVVLAAGALLAVFAFWVHDALPGSRFGRALRASGDDPLAAAHAGIALARVRGLALVVGAVPAALAGGLYPLRSGYLSPESAFGLETALGPVVAVLIGGPGTRWGALLGTVLFVGVQEVIWTRLGAWNLALLGAGLIAVGLLRPAGVAAVLDPERGGAGDPASRW